MRCEGPCERGHASAKLQRLDIPVRAIVIPLPARAPAAARLNQVARRVLAHEFPPAGGARGGGDSVWYQDHGLYHFSVFHASHHLAGPYTSPPFQLNLRNFCGISRVGSGVSVT